MITTTTLVTPDAVLVPDVVLPAPEYCPRKVVSGTIRSVATAAPLAKDLASHLTANVPQPSTHPERRARNTRKRLLSLIVAPSPRPPRAGLMRACRIALMETEEPVSAEMIYERIIRRGSLMFWSYKRPFRAISGAMSALVKLGEACLLKTGRQRRWHRTIPIMPYERTNRIHR